MKLRNGWHTSVIACGYVSEVLEFVEASFDEVARFVCFEVVGDQRPAGRIAGDDSLGPHPGDDGAQGVAVIGLVGEDTFGLQPFEQGGPLGNIAALARRQDQPQRTASSVPYGSW